MTPPRSVWVVLRDGIITLYPFLTERAAILRAHPTLDTVARYDLHRTKPKRKARKGEKRVR